MISIPRQFISGTGQADRLGPVLPGEGSIIGPTTGPSLTKCRALEGASPMWFLE